MKISDFISPTQVMIFSNCEQVRLIQNGREIGVQSSDGGHRVAHPPFTFKVERFAKEESTIYMTGVAKVGTPFGERTVTRASPIPSEVIVRSIS